MQSQYLVIVFLSQVETTGVENLEDLYDLEILFLTCDEINSLGECMNLKRLAMLDNGLKLISNVAVVGRTLVSLCLCDQSISKMENLGLPVLEELFLHRNSITQIEGLNGCPRLKRLWLFQNKITHVSGLHSVPDLEECWLQGNEISSLRGFETNERLSVLFLAGNPINDFTELKLLSNVHSLKELSLHDIHFGKCPIVDNAGYKDFILCYIRQVQMIDGIVVTKEKQIAADDSYATEVSECLMMPM